MGKIRALSEDVIGKIAAGEVVERPAAAIKELCENSLDAGATAVTIEVREDACDYMRVTDNGSGIDESDLRLAFARHATSKIRQGADLDAIATLGFRGEALHSIAAVGRVTLITRTDSMETGVRVQNEGGQITDMEETACPRGTTIIVRDLFFNAPVRRNFLKKPGAENGAIGEIVSQLILSRPDVSFRLICAGKTVYYSPGGGKPEGAVQAVFGTTALRQMRRVEGKMNGVQIHGYVGIGELGRSNRRGECFFINRRMMRSGALSAALENACRERVMIGKYPMAVILIDLPYERVNVNVHPNKLEVRFQNERGVCEALEESVREALLDRDAFEKPVEMDLVKGDEAKQTSDTALREAVRRMHEENRLTVSMGNTVPEMHAVVPDGKAGTGRTADARPVATGAAAARAWAGAESVSEGQGAAEPQQAPGPLDIKTILKEETGSLDEYRDTVSAGFRTTEARPTPGQTASLDPDQTASFDPDQTASLRPSANAIARADLTGEVQDDPVPSSSAERKTEVPRFMAAEEPAEMDTERIVPSSPAGNRMIPAAAAEPRTEQLVADLPAQKKPMRIYGALFDTYILIEYEDRLLMVDQHAVHERLLFDQLMASFGQERLGQEMLTPITVSVTKNEMRLIEENRELLEGIGLVAEPFGETDVAIRTMPVILGDVQPATFLRDVLGELEIGRAPSMEKKRTVLLQTACKHAVKGGEKLGEDQLRQLVEEMIEKKVTPTCPHGRPLVVSISHRELDKKFRRIQE